MCVFTELFSVSIILKEILPVAEEAFRDIVSWFVTLSFIYSQYKENVQELEYYVPWFRKNKQPKTETPPPLPPKAQN